MFKNMFEKQKSELKNDPTIAITAIPGSTYRKNFKDAWVSGKITNISMTNEQMSSRPKDDIGPIF